MRIDGEMNCWKKSNFSMFLTFFLKIQSMVSTYRSTDVAVKQLKNVSLFSPELREFVAEAVLMAELRPHKNVVQFLGKSKSPVFLKKKKPKT